MKKAILCIAAAVFTTVAVAQTTTPDRTEPTQTTPSTTQGTTQTDREQNKDAKAYKKDHVIMKDGRVFLLQNGQTTEVKSDIALNNGATVTADGTVKMKDGSTKKMSDGDMVDMSGNWGKADKDMMKNRAVKEDNTDNNQDKK